MRVDLEFVADNTRVHADVIEGTDYIPVPNVGDTVTFSGNSYVIEHREFVYGKTDQPGTTGDYSSVKISLTCKMTGETD
jgi:hypothetical protein